MNIGGRMTQCVECRFYSMWEGNCCFPGKNFMHVAIDQESCEVFESEEESDKEDE